MAGGELGGAGMNPVWVEKAKRAFETGQPRMAELYMRRGLRETETGRQWLAWYDLRRGIVVGYRIVGEIAEKILAGFRIAEPMPLPTPLVPMPVFHFGEESAARIDRMMAQFRLEQQAALQVRTTDQLRFRGIA